MVPSREQVQNTSHNGVIEGDVLDAVQQSPYTSVCSISTQTGIPLYKVWRILHGMMTFTTISKKLKQFLPGDDDYHIQFCK